MNAIGQSLSRADGRLKVTGQARYTADVRVDDALHASIVHSTIANGNEETFIRHARQTQHAIGSVL